MQIEIPDLDDDYSQPTPLANKSFGGAFSPTSPLLHNRNGSNSSTKNPTGFSFSSFTSPLPPTQSSSRPFGGQNNSNGVHPSIPMASSSSHPLESQPVQEMFRKASLKGQQLHTSPSIPSIKTSQNQSLISLPSIPRKLSIASLRSGNSSRLGHAQDNGRLARNGNDLSGNYVVVNPSSPSPFSPTLSNGPNSKIPRTRGENLTNGTTNTAGGTTNEMVTPLEAAMHLVLERFSEECETKLGQLLGKQISTSPEEDVYIPYFFGQGADPSFDSTIESLAQVSKKTPSHVVKLVLRWKNRQGESVDDYYIQRAVNANTAMSTARATLILSERKSLALNYILCRAMIAILLVVTREGLGEDLGSRLEDIVFLFMRNSDPYLTARTPNKQANMNMFAHLLGALSTIRFASVCERFASEVEAMNRAAAVRDQKDTEARLGYLIRSVQFLKLKIYPPEAFEETAEFIGSFASIFDTSRGSIVKIAIAETLGPLLSQVAQSATAEVNHPVWNKAIFLILNKAHSMSDKPSKARYWGSTVPLICAAVGTAPQDVLVARWTETVDWCFSKLKEKSTRSVIMLGMVQLVWTYLHRVREGVSALNKRLEPILKSAFPSDRRNVYPPEASLEIFVSLINFILYWQLEYGSDFVLGNLLSGPSEASDSGLGLVAQAGPERISIAITASLRALTSLEKVEDPMYPTAEAANSSKILSPSQAPGQSTASSSQNFNTSDGQALKPEILERPRVKAFVDAIGIKVLQIAAYSDRTLAPYTLTDDKYVSPWHESILHRTEALDGPTITQRHGAFAVEYPRQLQPVFEALQICLHAWPRLLTSPASESAALGILFRGLISLNFSVTIESEMCLRRFLAAGKSFSVLQSYTRFLAKPEFFFRFKPHLQKGLDNKVEKLVKLWVETLSAWCDQIRKSLIDRDDSNFAPSPNFRSDGSKLVCQTEATGLVLLCNRSPFIRRSALDALRITATARSIIEESEQALTPRSMGFDRTSSVAGLFNKAESNFFDSVNVDDLSSGERARLIKWKKHRKVANGEGLTRLLESDSPTDSTLHFYALSAIFSIALQHLPDTVVHARSLLYGQLQRVYPLASEAAGIGGRATSSGNGMNPGWDDRNLHMTWARLLITATSITTSTDPKTGNLSTTIDTMSNSGHQSGSNRDRNISPGDDLIKTLVPFLTSDQSPFREATIRAMSCIHVSLYNLLLDGLSGLAHHLTSERKMIEAQKDRSAHTSGNAKIIRLFSAIGKLHESTTRFLFHPDFVITERCVDILLRFVRETSLFLRSRQTAEDYVTISIRKSFLIFSERLLRKLGAGSEAKPELRILRLCPHELLLETFNMAEDWSTRPLGSGSTNLNQSLNASSDSRPSRNNSISSRANIPKKGGGSSSSLSTSSGPELLVPAASMIATLCESAFDVRTVGSPQHLRKDELSTDRPNVSVGRILRWIVALLEKNDSKAHIQVRRAFIGSARTTSDPERFLEAALAYSWNDSELFPLSQTLFCVIGSAFLAEPKLRFRDSALLALCLSRMIHSDIAIRQRALDVLKFTGLLGTQLDWLSEIEVSLASNFTGQHFLAQFSTSRTLCSLRNVDPLEFVIELGSRIMQIDPPKSEILARLLPTWLTQIRLSTPDSSANVRSKTVLTAMVLVSSRMGELHPEEARSIWRAFSGASTSNIGVITNYLLDQTTRRASSAFVHIVRSIILCMTEDNGPDVVAKNLLITVEPAKLTQSQGPPPPIDIAQASRTLDLDSYFPPSSSRTTVSPMQAAILLLGEIMILHPSALGERLPHILHAYIIQADHTNLPLQGQMRETLNRLVCILQRRLRQASDSRQSSSLPLESSDKEPWRSFWDFDDMGNARRHRKSPPENLERLVQQIISLSSHLLSDFPLKWARVAMEWATQCPVRHVACRSLQVFRVLGVSVEANLLTELLARLSNTASGSSPDIQLFSLEVLTSFTACAKFHPINPATMAQLFWTGVSCLESANDSEFLEAINLLKALLESVNDSNCFEIEASKPANWKGKKSSIRQLAIKGLRSSQTCQASWSLFKALLGLPQISLAVDLIGDNIGLFYAACLPWCLHILETGVMQYEMDEIAIELSRYAESTQMDGLSRIMVSFAKRRFRTKDDFLRQAVNGVREYFLPVSAPEILQVYLGLLFNPLEWLRGRTLAVLKLYVRMIDPNSPEIINLGYDLLTPLLNLLQTNVSQQAIEILAEPLPMRSKIPNIRSKVSSSEDDGSKKKVFGRPDETGWCVPNQQEAMSLSRSLLVDVAAKFATSFNCDTLKRSSVVEFTYDWGNEPDSNADTQTQSDFAETNESFGDMVSTLHDLSDFFGQDGGPMGSKISSPFNPSTARVAAILSRSLSKRRANRPSLHVERGNINTALPTPLQTPTQFFSSSSRPQSLISSSCSSPLQLRSDIRCHNNSLSLDSSRDGDIFEGDEEEGEDEEGEEEAGRVSPAGTHCTDDSQPVFAFDLDDDNYRLMRQKSKITGKS
ncbi:cell morphogenesis N-terminal-domain-containing protein [Phakopsora pachyrhizi]|uniref:Cell morphogenesis N-terminal-domain-containing protein n=1 Tax=Phakopsora pachyrhizi TaxID=170000 RepID=A0AAV0AU87_PHAPC|nr:cell morphogenesis N-terminal-domain-containing protein [Phakopsora pachyrhizi]